MKVKSYEKDFFGEAERIREVLKVTGKTQMDLCRSLNMSQGSLANKIRLLKLTKEERELITDNHLTERHARAFVRINNKRCRLSVIKYVIENKLTVSNTDDFVTYVLNNGILDAASLAGIRTDVMYRCW